jgi:hypothetical protein
MLEPLPGPFATTRDAMHALAEHVVAPFRFGRDGHIGLLPSPGGFGTPALEVGERVRVEGVELVHERPGTTTRVGITTIGAAAQFLDIAPGVPEGLYAPATSGTPDAPLGVDAHAAHVLATWIAFVDALLAEIRAACAGHDASAATLWPEHFDLACEIGAEADGTRANYGGSPGDGAIGEPYLYVGPWDASRRTGPLGTHPWGAAITYAELRATDDPTYAGRGFFAECAALLLGAT